MGLSGAALGASDEDLETEATRQSSYYRALAEIQGASLVDVVRGPTSIGGLMEAAGYKAVPSPRHPGPNGGHYFLGGFNSRTHGSREHGVIDASQLEMSYAHINQEGETRVSFARALALSIKTFMETHYAIDLTLDAP